jgi:sucrose-phosphate synthase
MGNKRYIQMFSIHGLIRSNNPELGRNADTGGQVTYVLELARQLSTLDTVARVDLFTRLIGDKTVSNDYASPMEIVNDKFRIVRIQCGGRKYLRKELLWPHLDEFIDKTVKFIKREQAIPDVVHGHYPDAGYVAMELARFFGVPFIFTGHSLGRVKKQKLLSDGVVAVDLERRYKIDHRIAVEEEVLSQADLIVTSTRQEIVEQYGLYSNNSQPDFKVIPPGLDVERFYPYYRDMLPQNDKDEAAMFARASVMHELNRFFLHPDKPLILALCRPDKRKNITGLVRAYGEDLDLQAMANLAVFAGIRKDIESMESNEREVLTDMLLRLDQYDLYGKMAIPKKHDFESEVPELYRVAAEKGGVFVNSALTEPFGLTLLEASATGLPIVATHDGGPKDIVENCKNGLLVDPSEPGQIAQALRAIIADREQWDRYSKNGIMNVRKYYTWERHARHYMTAVEKLAAAAETADMGAAHPTDAIGRRLTSLNALFVTDIDHTLIGEDNTHLKTLLAALKANRSTVGFVVATGRTIESVRGHLEKYGVEGVDVLITSVGAEIYYGPRLQQSRSWESHIAAKWEPAKIRRALRSLPYLTYQEEDTQRRFKISYYMEPGKDRLAEIHNRLLNKKCKYNLVYSHDQYLDILPYRASKGKAIRFLCYKWEIPLRNIVVSGDSGNDEEMLRGEPSAIVVANYSAELDVLRKSKHVYFARKSCAGGILEGLQKYRFFEKAKGDA